MNLLEFFKLTEAKQVYFNNTKWPEGGLALYSKRRSPPNMVILPLDNQPIASSENLLIIRAKVRTGDKINIDNIRNGKKDPQWENAWYGWGRGHVDMDDVEKYPQVWSSKPINGQAALFRYLTTDIGLGRETYEQVIGPAPEELGDEAIQFHNARLFVPTNMSKRGLAAAMKTLEHVYQYLNAKNLGDLVQGDIRFVRLAANVGGTYNMGNGDMQVNPKIKDDGQTIYSLLHEYGHKYMEEVANRQAIVDRYTDLKMEGEGHMPDLDTASALQSAAEAIKPGTQIHYKGRGWLAKDRDYVVKSVSGGKVWVANTANPSRVVFSIAPLGLIRQPNRWEIEGDIDLPLEKI